MPSFVLDIMKHRSKFLARITDMKRGLKLSHISQLAKPLATPEVEQYMHAVAYGVSLVFALAFSYFQIHVVLPNAARYFQTQEPRLQRSCGTRTDLVAKCGQSVPPSVAFLWWTP